MLYKLWAWEDLWLVPDAVITDWGLLLSSPARCCRQILCFPIVEQPCPSCEWMPLAVCWHLYPWIGVYAGCGFVDFFVWFWNSFKCRKNHNHRTCLWFSNNTFLHNCQNWPTWILCMSQASVLLGVVLHLGIHRSQGRARARGGFTLSSVTATGLRNLGDLQNRLFSGNFQPMDLLGLVYYLFNLSYIHIF